MPPSLHLISACALPCNVSFLVPFVFLFSYATELGRIKIVHGQILDALNNYTDMTSLTAIPTGSGLQTL
jgi:hypothetical protein